MRTAEINRITGETNILLKLELDGTGKSDIKTGVGFLDHMLILFAKHGRFDLEIKAEGDTWVDDHHTTEDIAICLGKAFAEALGDCRGICRFADRILPMDEALVLAALDISGRSTLVYDLTLKDKVGTFDTELVEEFFTALCREMGLDLHIKQLAGKNTHHIIEATFKGVARALKQAVKIEGDEIPSTKGAL